MTIIRKQTKQNKQYKQQLRFWWWRAGGNDAAGGRGLAKVAWLIVSGLEDQNNKIKKCRNDEAGEGAAPHTQRISVCCWVTLELEPKPPRHCGSASRKRSVNDVFEWASVRSETKQQQITEKKSWCSAMGAELWGENVINTWFLHWLSRDTWFSLQVKAVRGSCSPTEGLLHRLA